MSLKLNVLFEDLSEQNKVVQLSESVNEGTKVIDIMKKYGLDENNYIHCIYRGTVLNEDSILVNIGIKSGSVLKIIKGLKVKSNSEDNSDNYEKMVNEILKKHKEILKSQKHDLISNIVLENVTEMIDLNDELEQNLMAHSIATDPKLLKTLFSSKEYVEKVLKKYPILIPTALSTIQKIHNKLRQVKQSQSSSHANSSDSRFYSIESVEQSDSSSSGGGGSDGENDEDISDSMAVSTTPNNSSSSSTTNRAGVTRNQLMEALDQVIGLHQTQPSNTSVTQSQTRPSHRPNQPVSRSQFRAALRSATTSALSTTTPSNSTVQPMEVDRPSDTANVGNTNFDDKVRQLVSMGFCDEAAARIALEATGGDVNAAVEFLLG